MKVREEEILIIGAGLSALMLARSMRALGKSCLLLEKSRGIGGRIATRRIEDLGFDHGASFLSDSEYFEDFLKMSKGIVHHSPQGFYIEGGMNHLAKFLATDLEILKNQRAQIIEPHDSRWKIQTAEGLTILASKVVITAPLPQAVELLDQNRLQVPAQLRAIQYKPALIYLAVLKEIPENLTSFSHQQNMIYLMRERQLHPRGIVMHLSEAAAADHFEKSDAEILQLMREVISSAGLQACEIEKEELKKWRYSQPLSRSPEAFAEILPKLYLTGDAFTGAHHSTNNLVQVLGSLA